MNAQDKHCIVEKIGRGRRRKVWQINPFFAKLKPSKLVITINNLLADLLIYQTFLCHMFKKNQFAKPPHQTFPLYQLSIVLCLDVMLKLKLTIRDNLHLGKITCYMVLIYIYGMPQVEMEAD